MEEIQPLDDHFENREITVDAPIFQTIIKYGIIGSIILVLISILQFSIGANSFNNEFSLTFMVYIISIGIGYLSYIGVMTFAIINYKKINEGFASFGKAFAVTFLTGFVMSFASMIFRLVVMLGFGITTFGMSDFSEMDNAFGNKATTMILVVWSSLSSMIFGAMGGAIVALIISAITKKERPLGFRTF